MSRALETIQVNAEKILDRGGGRYQQLQDVERGGLHQVRIRYLNTAKCLRFFEIGDVSYEQHHSRFYFLHN